MDRKEDAYRFAEAVEIYMEVEGYESVKDRIREELQHDNQTA